MKVAPPFDKDLGLEYYVTDTCPAGGVIKKNVEDFVVEEVLKDGVVVALEGVSLKPTIGGWTWIHVVKQNVDTLKLAVLLAKKLGISYKDVSLGGIKDTRALTSQIFSVRGSVDKLPEVPNVKFLGIWSMDRPMTPGEIYGNRFTIVLRDVEDVKCAEETVERLSRTPLPNYYGYQRFGTIRPVSHMLGRALLKKDAEEFFHIMFCRIYPKESENAKKAREYACRGQFDKALETFPKRFLEERALLRKLIRGSDMWNSVMAIPPQILRIYIEAFQSYIFNKLLSRRMELGPINKPIEGDLVEVNGQVVYYTEGLGGDVVLPIVGIGARAPSGRVGEIYVKILKKEKVDTSAFYKMPKWLRVYGGYRRAVLKITEFIYTVGRDIELRFILPKGGYATVVLREIVKPADPPAHGF
ncbi:MAG: tRNA pseudouridine(13) synthase TruD [Pyrobaculum sp.]